MRKFTFRFLVPVLLCLSCTASAQVTLSGTTFTENFDGLGSGLPAGFTVHTNATATAIGTAATLNTNTNVYWTTTTGQFANYASGDIGASASTATQAAATDRALGLRQTGGFGDPGAAFVFQVSNTTGFTGFTLDFNLQSLSTGSPRTTIWRVDYGFGSSPSSFTEATATGSLSTGASTFSTNAIHVDFGSALDNQAGVVTIRITAITASTGSGSRATTAIDDFTLNWTAGGGGPMPTLLTDITSLAFPVTETGVASTAMTYSLTGTDLTDDVTVSVPAPFSVSADDITYSASIIIDETDAALVTGKTIYVKFTPTAATAYSEAVSNASTGATTKVVGVTGTGVSYINLSAAPYTESFDGIATGLPAGITVRTGATAGALGTTATYTPAKTNWNSTSGGFYNYASGDIGTGEPQSGATDRALGIRQTGSLGDPGGAFVFQVANTTGKINFTLDFALQSLDENSTRTTTWLVDYGFGSNPVTFSTPTVTGTLTTGGSTFSNNAIHVDFGSALDDQPDIVTIRVVALTASSGSGSRATSAIDDLTINWEDPAAKTISLNTTAISFATTAVGASATQSYTIVSQTNLDQPIVITTAAPYSVSTDNITFSSSVMVAPVDAFNKTIYVRFAPAVAGVFNGTVNNASDGAPSKVITLSGEAIDPSALGFNFNSCSAGSIPGSGFLSINTTGSQQWGCSQYGHNSSNGVSVNGYFSGSAQANEAWLISPALDLSSIVNMPVLSFYSRGEFTGPVLQLYVSTDYDGSSSPATATWTEITNANFPTPPGAATTEWTLSDNIDLSAYKSAPQVYIAFKYTSSPALNAARWSIDDVTITDQSTLLQVSPLQINFGEAATGTQTAGQAVSVRAVGTTDITLAVPAGFEISADNISFSTAPLLIDQVTADAGTTVYIRFAPTVKALTITGYLNISGTGLNKNTVALSGSSYPKAETFDAATYNLSFFGSNSNNNPTPAQITTQINNIATVLQTLDVDVIGFEEMSSDSALGELLLQLPGYDAVVANRWSYSFNPPDPDFPPQKTGFIYNSGTMTLSATEPPRVMFEAMYDSARLGLPGHRLADYPTGSPSSFWSSGRLPYMATFTVTVNGQTKTVRLIVIHAKSSSDQASYNRRVYDLQVLKDSIDAFYRNDNVILLGDYNDRLEGSIYSGSTVSPYAPFVSDNTGYSPLTYSLDTAGKVSFINGSGLIDHIIITQPLLINYINGSTVIEDPRLYIAGYNATTASDHLPVYSRFAFPAAAPLPVTLLQFSAKAQQDKVLVNWTTSSEQNNDHFLVERSDDGRKFTAIGRIPGAVNSSIVRQYSFTDGNPLPGTGYYRLRQVDIDGKANLSKTVAVRLDGDRKPALKLSPNPVRNFVSININTTGKTYTARISGMDGRTVIQATGGVNQVNRQVNHQLGKLTPGIYVLQVDNEQEHYRVKFVKQ